ncbi:unnamed protein product [Notodromas monacha]|uniref:Uncharacterized protein n=1 Tax=Notodromas monacha TaxID=399045 RepID=A0A7R9BPV8_9CRUS|nr:unnamed protein product [Notodromas monacha]CAG0918125.1 unnamed protein product [Notodromas monacha]
MVLTGISARLTYDGQVEQPPTGVGDTAFFKNTDYNANGRTYWITKNTFDLPTTSYPNVGVTIDTFNVPQFIRYADTPLVYEMPFYCQAGCPMAPPAPPSGATMTSPPDEYHGYGTTYGFAHNSVRAVYKCPAGSVFSGFNTETFISECVGKQGWVPNVVPSCEFPTTQAPNTNDCPSPPVPPLGMSVSTSGGSSPAAPFVSGLTSQQYKMYNGTAVNVTELHDPLSPPSTPFNASQSCLVLYDSMKDGNWFATEDICTGAANWMSPSPFICQAVEASEYTTLTDRRLYRVKSTDPTKHSARNITTMNDFCYAHRCGVLAELRSPSEIISATVLLDGIYPLDVPPSGIGSSQRVMISPSKRSVYTSAANVSASHLLYDGVTALNLGTANGSGDCVLLEKGVSGWVYKKTECFPATVSEPERLPFLCQAVTTEEPTTEYTTDPPSTTPAWPGSPADAIFLNWSPLEDDATLYSFEFYGLGNGTLDLLVLQPGCATESYCSSSDVCRTSCGAMNGNLIVPCDVNPATAICSLERQCEVSGTPVCTSGQKTQYTIVNRFTVSVLEDGHVFYPLDPPLPVKKGFIVGFDPSRGARIAWRSVAPGESPDAGGVSLTETFTASDYGATNGRHYIRANLRNPFIYTVPLVYPGPMLNPTTHGYQFKVQLTSNQAGVNSSSGNGSYINVQIPITGFNMSIQPLHVVVGTAANLSYFMTTGSNVSVTYDWGDSSLQSQIINNCTNSSFSRNHTYVNEGIYQIRITVKNEWGTFTWNHTLHAQYPVTTAWKLMDDAPVLLPPGDVVFQTLYPIGMRLPTDATALLEYGDGQSIQFPIDEGFGQGFNFTSNRTYEKRGTYYVQIKIHNLASMINITNRVQIYERIINLGSVVQFLPFLPRASDIKDFCDERYGKNYTYKWVRYIDMKMEFTHTYYERGFFMVEARAHNDLSMDYQVVQFPISGIPCAPPHLWIRFNDTRFWAAPKYIKGRTTQLVALGFLDCNITLVTKKAWEIVKVEPTLGLLREVITNISALPSHNKSILAIPPGYLDVGIYRAKYTMTILVNEESELDKKAPFQRSAYSYLIITPTSLEAYLTKGGETLYRRGVNQSLALLPTLWSIDPDDPDNNQDFEIKWWCKRQGENLTETGMPYWAGKYNDSYISVPLDTQRNNLYYETNNTYGNETIQVEYPDLGGCFGWGPGLLNISDQYLVLNMSQFRTWPQTYEIIAEVKKGMRRDYKALQVEIVEGNPPLIEIGCQTTQMCLTDETGMRFNPSMRTSLIAICTQNCMDESSLTWSWTISINVQGVTQTLNVTQWAVGHDEHQLAISKDLYSNYSFVDEFFVDLLVTTQDGEIGRAAVNLRRNLGPDAICGIDPPKNKILSFDSFGNSSKFLSRTRGNMIQKRVFFSGIFLRVKTKQKKGGNELGKSLLEDFDFYCNNFTDPEDDALGRYVLIARPMSGLMYTKQLRYGKESESRFVLPFGDWSLSAEVHDAFGAFTEIFLENVTVSKPSPDEFETWLDSQEMTRNLGEGDQNRLNQVVFAIKLLKETGWPELEPPPTTTTQPSTTTTFTTTEAPSTTDPYFNNRDSAVEEINSVAAAAKKQEFYLKQMRSINADSVLDCVQLFDSLRNMVGQGQTTDTNGRALAAELLTGDCVTKTLTNIDLSDSSEVAGMVESMLCAMTALLRSTAQLIMTDQVLPTELNWNGMNASQFAMAKLDLERRMGMTTTVTPLPGSDPSVSTTTTLSPDDLLLEEMIAYEQSVLETQKAKAKNDTDAIVQAVESMQQKITSILLAAETPVRVIGSCGTDMELVVNMMVRVIKRIKEAYNYTVDIPNVYLEVVNSSYTQNYTNYTTETRSDYRFSTEIVDVVDIEQDIVISIPIGSRDENGTLTESATMPEMSFFPTPVARRGHHMVYFQFNISNPYSGMSAQIATANVSTKLAVFIGRYKQPNAFTGEYDFVYDLRKLRHYNYTDKRLQPWDPYNNDTKEYQFPIYNVFVNDIYVANWTGTYWVGLLQFVDGAETEAYFQSPKANNLTWNNILDANTTHTVCGCNHLTNFGSGFFVMPNTIDFDYVFANAGFLDNLTIYCTLIVVTSLYIFLVVWARKKDKKDVEQLGVIPLPDNKPEDKYLYEILVMTGQGAECATHSQVSFILSGEYDETDVRTFGDQTYLKRQVFQSGQFDNFVMATGRPMGPLNYLRIWHDNTGKGQLASWYLNFIVIRDLQTGEKYQFIANEWFAVEKGDGLIDRLLPVAGKEQMSQFAHLFQSTSKKNLQDGHLWFSIFMRPPRSRFTRVQRVSSCVALLYLSMLVNAMWYQRTADDTASGMKFGPFSISPEQIGVGVMSNLIVFPPSFLIIYLFRNSRRRVLRDSRIEKAIGEQRRKQLDERKNNPFADRKRLEQEDQLLQDASTSSAASEIRYVDASGNVMVKKRMERKKKFLLP